HLPVDPVKVKPAQQDELHCALIRKYERANNLAMKARDKYKRVWKWAIFLGWLTVVCFACKTAFHLEGTAGYMLTLSEFLFVVAVYALTFYAKKRKYHGHYLGERMKAETCRLLFCFYHAGVRIDISDKAKEDSSMAASAGDINQSLRVAGHRSKWYTQYVIRTLIHEQCSYHHNKVKTIGNTHELAERINLFIAVAFVVNLAAHLIHLSVQEEAWHFWLYDLSVFFNILLPASYAALEGVIYFNEWALLKKHSEVAGKRLGEAEHLLPENLSLHSDEDCHKKQARVLHIVSETMLTDNRNWNLLLENKNNYHLIV
ncbi:MAG TPA: hypothetical protein VK563_19445, partial [Puia sp.]|nr:hypothetical protein [Puia sp.]